MADRSRWDYGERDRDRDRYRGSRYDRGDETNRGMFGYEGEGYLRGGGRDIEDRDFTDDFGRINYGGNRGRDDDRSDRYGSAGREFRGRDYNAGGEWGGGNLRSDYDRNTRDIAGYRGTGYLGGDYGQARLDRNDFERDYSRDTFGETRGRNEQTQQSYRGRGPKNYQRSDDRIREDVCERLERDHRVDASELEVNVNGGVVTLSGSVNDRDMKRRAEDLAESCGGVSDVQNQIRVNR